MPLLHVFRLRTVKAGYTSLDNIAVFGVFTSSLHMLFNCGTFLAFVLLHKLCLEMSLPHVHYIAAFAWLQLAPLKFLVKMEQTGVWLCSLQSS